MSDMERKSRVDDAREIESRNNTIMKNLRMVFQGPLDVPSDEIPDNMDYLWIRDTLIGDPSQSRFPEMKKRGWMPVPASRHPNLVEGDAPWRPSDKSSYLFCKGLVLCERPKHFGEEERRLNHEYNIKLLTGDASADFLSDPSFPLKVYKNDVGILKTRTFKND